MDAGSGERQKRKVGKNHMSTQEDPEEGGQIIKAKRMQGDKKRTVSYLKSRVEEFDRAMAQNFAKGNFALAGHDARRMAAILDVLGEIDVTQ